MSEINLSEAFASYKAKPTRRGRSAVTPEGSLVISCWYAGFQKAQKDVLRYEEDLSGQAGETVAALRTHLVEAVANQSEILVVVAVVAASPAGSEAAATTRTTYYARKDLVGRIASFEGDRFALEFRRTQATVQAKSISRPR